MKSKIVKRDNPILRRRALKVTSELFGTKKFEAILVRMQKALHTEEDGVAIAAPQIGVSLRIFVVNGETLALMAKEKGKIIKKDDLIFINPELTKLSKEKTLVEEGCLSIRWLYGKVKRSNKATIKAQDASGKSFTMGASGLLAQIFQHETDHLNGILFTDKAKELEEIKPTKPRK